MKWLRSAQLLRFRVTKGSELAFCVTMAGGKRSKKKLELAERRAVAMALRKQGLSYRDIAARMLEEGLVEGYSHVQAFRDVDAVLKDIRDNTSHDAEEYTTLELSRLDSLWASLKEGIDSGDTKSVNAALGVSQTRIRLLGLEPKIKIEVEQTVTTQFLVFFQQIQTVFPAEVANRVIGEARKLPCLATAANQLETVDVDSKVISTDTIEKIRQQIYGVYPVQDDSPPE